MKQTKISYSKFSNNCKSSYKTLNKIHKNLEGSLKNPKLGKEEQRLLRESLKITKDYLKRINEMFEKYGEFKNE